MESRLRQYVDRYVALCFERQTAPGVSELAAWLDISRSLLAKRFLQEEGKSIGVYLREQKIERAKWLLQETDLSIEAVAQRAAFRRARSFYRTFFRVTGITPAAYRRLVRSSAST
jgi:AraC-like DNA-binding protein